MSGHPETTSRRADAEAAPARQLVHDSAMKVAKPNSQAMFIDQNNRNAGYASIGDAAQSGRAFCVEVRDTILALDCDDPTLRPELEKIDTDLRAAGLEPVVVQSGGEGRRHLFCLILDPRVMDAYKDRVRRLGHGTRLEVRQKIRPPLAPHRQGLPVALLRPDDHAEALACLTPRDRPPLSPEWTYFRQFGATKGMRSQQCQGFALACLNAGWSRAEFLTDMTDESLGAGEKYRGRRDQLSRIESLWDNALSFAARHPAVKDRAEAVAVVARLRARANTWHWQRMPADGSGYISRRWDQACRRVLEAHFIIAERTGKLVYVASIREIAELAGCSLDTVVRAHKRLRHLGWLRLHQGAGRWSADASVWRLTGPTAHTVTAATLAEQSVPGGVREIVRLLSHEPNPGTDTESVRLLSHEPDPFMPEAEWWRSPIPVMKPPAPLDLGHDLWRPGAFGPTAGAIYAAVDPGWTAMTSAELSAKIGVRRRTVERHLAKLSSMWLVARIRYGWLRGDVNLDDVADILGVAKKAAAQRERHRQDREELKKHT